MSSAPVMSTVATRFPNGSTPSTWPLVIGYGGGVNAGQKSSGLSVVGQVRSARSPPEFVMAKSRAERRPHRVGDDVALERLAEPPVDATAGVRSRDGPVGRADRQGQDRTQRGVERVDPGLDGRVGRDAGVPRLVEVGRPVDDPAALHVDEDPDAQEAHARLRFSTARTPFGRSETTWKFVWSPMTTSTFSTPSARSISGPVGSVTVPAVRAFVADRHDRRHVLPLPGDPGRLGVHRLERVGHVERPERPGLRQLGDVGVREADDRRTGVPGRSARPSTSSTRPACSRRRPRCWTRRSRSRRAGSARCGGTAPRGRSCGCRARRSRSP